MYEINLPVLSCNVVSVDNSCAINRIEVSVLSTEDRSRCENNSPWPNAVRNAYDDASGSLKTLTLWAKSGQRFTRVPSERCLPTAVAAAAAAYTALAHQSSSLTKPECELLKKSSHDAAKLRERRPERRLASNTAWRTYCRLRRDLRTGLIPKWWITGDEYATGAPFYQNLFITLGQTTNDTRAVIKQSIC